MIIRWITLRARLKHHIVIIGFYGFLVVDDSIIGLLVEIQISERTLLGLEMHESQALSVWIQAFYIFELRANDILNTKSALE